MKVKDIYVSITLTDGEQNIETHNMHESVIDAHKFIDNIVAKYVK